MATNSDILLTAEGGSIHAYCADCGLPLWGGRAGTVEKPTAVALDRLRHSHARVGA